MNVHKFNVKPKYGSHKTIKWLIPRDAKYPAEKINTSTWKIFCQENIILRPNEVKQLTLGVGFTMSDGVVLVCLANSLREKRCSIQNEVNLYRIILKNRLTSRKTRFYVLSVIKNYDPNIKMTEMKELYPKLPTAPPIEDPGQGYRLQKISEIQAFLEKEVEERGK